MATKKTYIIRINDFFTDPEKCNTVDLEFDYDDPEKVAEDGWLILEAFATLHGLEYENQGDQYMAFYPEGHEQAGEGALTIEIYDNEGNRYEEL